MICVVEKQGFKANYASLYIILYLRKSPALNRTNKGVGDKIHGVMVTQSNKGPETLCIPIERPMTTVEHIYNSRYCNIFKVISIDFKIIAYLRKDHLIGDQGQRRSRLDGLVHQM